MGNSLAEITPRIEDYLEELFQIECGGGSVTVTELADRLGITKGTVTTTVQKLVELELVEHERYGALHLTDAGRRKGMIVSRRHEGFRAFFHEVLGRDRERSSEMACAMEHYLDESTEERLYALLEYFRRARAEAQPWVDEMLHAIEKPALSGPPLPLTLCQEGDRGTILRLTADEPIRKKLLDAGFSTGKVITLKKIADRGYTVQLGRETLNLLLNEAATIWIQSKGA